MAAEYSENLTDADKVKIISRFILQSPPGEFKEVLTDVRRLLNNDTLIKEQAPGVFAQYRKDQLTPVELEDSFALITEYNELPNGRFYDPKSQKSFRYDHIRDEATDFQPWTPPDGEIESWRLHLEEIWIDYCKEHYPNGVGSVFASQKDDKIVLVACVECHQFQPKNYCNGRWRSIWTATFHPKSDTQVDLTGVIKVQVHYFEDGNVQLISSKENKLSLNITNEGQTATEWTETVEKAEKEYQMAVADNYTNMSDTTFKALRRPLPVTKAKLDWHRLLNYKLTNEFRQQDRA